MRYVLTNQSVTTLFLQQILVTFCFNAIVNENFDEFITKFFSNRYDDDIYDAILIIIDCFLKMTHYIFAKLTWSIENLIDVLFNKILLIFFEIKKIVFNRETLFTSDYWSALYYCIRVVQKLNIVFHSQTDD